MMTKSLKSLLFFIVFSLLLGCASEEKNATTPDGLFNIAKEYDDAERYDVALQKYSEVKNKFPYSSFAVQAELAIADLHYKRESFPESQIAYQNFRDLHPKHPRIAYVVFRIAMSFYQQLPDSIDRDLALANDAIYHFNEVIKNYPASEFTIEAKEKRDKTYVMLSEKELYVADFYLKQEKFESSLIRYENVLRKYSGYGFDPKALLGATRAAYKLSQTEKQKKYAQELLSQYAKSNEASLIKSEGL